MNTYNISKKITTVSCLFDGFTLDNVNYSFYNKEDEYNHKCSGLLATASINSINFIEAYKIFLSKIDEQIDVLSSINQCYFSMSMTPTLICKEGVKEKYIIVSKEVNGNGMHITDDNIKDAGRLLKLVNKAPFHFIREANNAANVKTRSVMLFVALESMAGTEQRAYVCEDCGAEKTIPSTNKSKLIEIVGKDLANDIFFKHGSLRNKLLHGNIVDEQLLVEKNSEIHEKIIEYLINEHKLSGTQKITSGPRSIYANKYGGLFIKNKKNESLRTLNEQVLEMVTENKKNEDVEIVNLGLEELSKTF